MSEPLDLSRKLYYTIGEVAELTGIKAHVLRYWESEFPSLRPGKDRGGARRYRRGDIEQVLEIRELLHERGFRIAGARQELADRRRRGSESTLAANQLALSFDQLDRPAQLAEIRRELNEVRELVRALGRHGDQAPQQAVRADAAEG